MILESKFRQPYVERLIAGQSGASLSAFRPPNLSKNPNERLEFLPMLLIRTEFELQELHDPGTTQLLELKPLAQSTDSSS